MSLKCPSSPVYHTSAEQKLKSKNAAKLYRFGTPKLRDLLREKCRIRVKEARQMGFSQNRPEGSAGEAISYKDILRQELAELEYDITLQEEIYNELEDELNEWFVDQLEEEEDYLIEVAVSQDLVCPVCQVSNLVIFQAKTGGFNYRCKCNANFNFPANMESLRAKLSHCIDEHEQNCLTKLNFFVNPLTQQLEGICDNCDYFCSL
ncbi:RPA-interacting protein alpha [Cochliomyia hominivorax]